jgi:hypothetical protein
MQIFQLQIIGKNPIRSFERPRSAGQKVATSLFLLMIDADSNAYKNRHCQLACAIQAES